MQEDARKGGSQLETAHRAGNDQWQSDAGRADWLEPDLDVAAVLPLLRSRGARSVLDLGCGVGRHACFLAVAGSAVQAMDASGSALDYAARRTRDVCLPVTFARNSTRLNSSH